MDGMKKSIWDEAKEIDLVVYLDSLGHQPRMVRNNDYWYLSPFRQEKTPSFKVNRNQNVWFDHGTGEGGTIIDLGAKLYNCSHREFVERLRSGNSLIGSSPVRQNASERTANNKLEILSIATLQDPDLARYLKDRAIAQEVAGKYCSEIEFKIGSRNYKAIGFANQSGGYELRNDWFKGAASPKDLTFIDYQQKKLCILEGFIDFLSVQQVPERRFQNRIEDSDFFGTQFPEFSEPKPSYYPGTSRSQSFPRQ